MAPYIIVILVSCALLCASKASLLPRLWRAVVFLPVAVLPWAAQSWLLHQSSRNLETFLNGAPELENLCVIAVTQELIALALGWPLIAGFCRHRRLRLLSLLPSLLIFPGVLYMQFNGFRFFAGVPFAYVTLGASLIGFCLPMLLAELISWHRSQEDKIRFILNWEWIVFMLTLSMPLAARFKGFTTAPSPWEMQPVYVWLSLLGLVLVFAVLHLIWKLIKDMRGKKNELFD